MPQFTLDKPGLPEWLWRRNYLWIASMQKQLLQGMKVVLDWRLPIGLCAMAEKTAGPLTLTFVMVTGSHNVTGQAGKGTKSSFLLVVVRSLINFALQWIMAIRLAHR
jgi:hypothetical protein